MQKPALVLVLVAIGLAGEARAQGGYNPAGAYLGLAAGLVALDGGLLIGGTITGIGSSIRVSRREPSNAWFAASYVFAALNLGVAAIWVPIAIGTRGGLGGADPGWAAMAVGHATVGLWNVIMPSIGFGRGVAPVFVSGKMPSGRRWSGLAMQGSF